MKVQNPKNIEDYLKTQKRFKHLFIPENKELVKNIQENVNKEWEDLNKKTNNN